ncbi:MAG: sulfatase-like hydrolase/transferase [Planctomycetota bacterium]
MTDPPVTGGTGCTDMNILVIVADSLRVDHLGFHGSDVRTPNLDRLAAESAVFEDAYAENLPTRTRFATEADHCTPRVIHAALDWLDDVALAPAPPRLSLAAGARYTARPWMKTGQPHAIPCGASFTRPPGASSSPSTIPSASTG